MTSAANPAIKLLRSLQTKKGRADSGLFLGEGARLAAEAAAHGRFPEIIAFSREALERPMAQAAVEGAARAGARLIETTEVLLQSITRRENTQTVVGAYRQRLASLDAFDPGAGVIVALEGVRDPGNLGTIVRTADAVGAGGVALLGATCDPFSVEAVRATMGSIFAVPVARVAFEALESWRRAQRLALYGAHLGGASRHDGVDVAGGCVLLMGNEQSGLPEAMAAACDGLVRIPMRGRADSLNLAAATAVLLYDVWRRRGYDGARD